MDRRWDLRRPLSSGCTISEYQADVTLGGFNMLPILLADLKPPTSLGGSGSMLIGGLFLAAFFVIGGILFAKKRRKNTLGILLLFAALGARRGNADIPPRPPQGTPVELEIRMDSAAAGGPILQIPKHALGTDRADV